MGSVDDRFRERRLARIGKGTLETTFAKNMPDKGHFMGSCNRTACQKPGADWYNTSTRAYYCGRCAILLNRTAEQFRDALPCVRASGDPKRDSQLKYGEIPTWNTNLDDPAELHDET